MLYESHATRTWTLLWFGHAQGCSVNRMQLEHGRYSPTADTLLGSIQSVKGAVTMFRVAGSEK